MFDIYCDSGANIPEELLTKYDIKVLSYVISVNGEERLCRNEGEDFAATAKKFYDDMRAGAEVKTSLLTAEIIAETIRPSLERGRDVLFTFISSGISGTYNQGLKAKEQLEKLYPDRKVFVCDSANASMGEGLQVIQAAKLRDMGESAEACAQWIKDNAYKINSYLTVGDLKYLKRTGRISATLAIAGTILNIKPVLRADGGDNAKIVFFDKKRGRKHAIEALAEAFAENAENPQEQTVAICHADSEEDALTLKSLIEEKGAGEVIVEYYDICTGSHVGPGTVALFFYGKDRRAADKPKPKLFGRKPSVQKA